MVQSLVVSIYVYQRMDVNSMFVYIH